MRTKTLLLTAALSAAGLATSMAQVYSVNAVGYVNVTVPAPVPPSGSSYCILANPLNGTNNSLNTILPLAPGGENDGCNIFRFDTVVQSFADASTWIGGLGWINASDPDPTVNPGEGFFFQNVTGSPINITFVGEVPSGTLNNPIPGNNRYSIRSSMVPKGLKLGNVGVANTLEFPATDGDTAFIFDQTIQQYKDAYTYLTGIGWISASDPDPDGPLIPPATGFFSQKVGPDVNWTQTFSPGN